MRMKRISGLATAPSPTTFVASGSVRSRAQKISCPLLSMKRLKIFLYSNMDVFALDDAELGCTSLVQHEIDTSDNSPTKQHFRRVPFVHREMICLRKE